MSLRLGMRSVVLLLAIAFALPATSDERSSQEAEQRQAELDSRIAELIEQLGSAEFPRRAKAKNELIRLGLSAFDALDDAQYHRDLEIGLQARYLLRSAMVAWIRDEDPPEVKSILKGYGHALPPLERSSRIERLAQLENRQGWDALCRLVRYETDQHLSKEAALAILRQDPPAAEQSDEAAEALQLGAGQSRRRAAQWLRTYARSLREPETILAEWTRLVNEEFEILHTEKNKTRPETVTKLARWHAESLRRHGHDQETKSVVKKLDGLLDGSSEKLLDHIDWLGHREMWEYILDAHKHHEALFSADPMLLYRLAEAQRRSGDEAAAATAAQALAINGDNADAHVQAGFKLAERGLFDWAESEYLAVLGKEKLESMGNLRARFLLSEMLHDQLREADAAEILKPLVDDINTKELSELIERMGRSPGSIKSRMHYFQALDLLSRSETEKAREALHQGVDADPQDADVLIALYRLPNQSELDQTLTQRLVRQAAARFQDGITEQARNLSQVQAQAQSEAIANYYRYELAKAHNQFAWLVANTEGDFEAAVASSHESLKLRPGEPAYLDTLGRCYFANGDLPNAIKYQSQAVRKEPHSGQMARQLALFKRELEKKNR